MPRGGWCLDKGRGDSSIHHRCQASRNTGTDPVISLPPLTNTLSHSYLKYNQVLKMMKIWVNEKLKARHAKRAGEIRISTFEQTSWKNFRLRCRVGAATSIKRHTSQYFIQMMIKPRLYNIKNQTTLNPVQSSVTFILFICNKNHLNNYCHSKNGLFPRLCSERISSIESWESAEQIRRLNVKVSFAPRNHLSQAKKGKAARS